MMTIFLYFLPDLRFYHVLVHSKNISSPIHKSPGRSAFAHSLCRLPQQILLWAQCKLISVMAVYIPWHLNQGLHPEKGSARQKWTCSHQKKWHTISPGSPSRESSSVGVGCHVSDLAEAISVLISPNRYVSGSSRVVLQDGVRLLIVATFWSSQVWFLDLMSLLDGSPWEIPFRRDLLSQVGGNIYHHSLEIWNLWVWPLRGINSWNSGLSNEVVETILNSRAPSRRKLYAFKW